jgi:hypothetical protein
MGEYRYYEFRGVGRHSEHTQSVRAAMESVHSGIGWR